jgi:hypothetical protein
MGRTDRSFAGLLPIGNIPCKKAQIHCQGSRHKLGAARRALKRRLRIMTIQNGAQQIWHFHIQARMCCRENATAAISTNA